MLKFNFKIALRNFWKNKVYNLINILGLSIGMASCMLIFIFVNYQLSFDTGYKNGDRIYRLVTNWKYPAYDDYSKGVPLPLVTVAKNEFAGFEKVSAIISRNGIIQIKDNTGKDKIKSQETVYYAEPGFFEMLDLPWIYSNPKQALTAPNTVALSESMAARFFGNSEQAVGKSFLFANKLTLKVTGVFKDMPENSSFPLKVVISYSTFNSKKYISWDGVNSSMECYVLLRKGLTLSDLEAPMAQFNKKYYVDKKIAGNQNNSLQPLRDIHFNMKYGNFADTSITRKEVYGLITIGLFLMLAACINFINLATAQVVTRSKEVGVRKVMGGKRKQLMVQFLTETFVITLIAMLIACILTELAIPALQDLFKGNVSFSLLGQPVIWLFMGVLLILVSFLAGFYPAMIMSGFSPVLAIKNKISVNSGGLNLRKILVVVQFAITIILIIGTLVIMKQMDYLRQKPLGFNPNAVAMIGMPSNSLSNTFKEQALRIPGIQMLSFCQAAPLSEEITTSEFSYGSKKNRDFELRNSKADENYFKLFDLKLLAGSVFKKSDTANGCVVNETFLKKMNISHPEEVIGKILAINGTKMPITGVVQDFNDQSLKEKISPLAIYAQKIEYYNAAVKMNSKEIVPAMKKLEVLYNKIYPDHIYNAQFVNDDINRFYENERITGVLFRVFAGVIIFISFIGLFGLISFVATQRTREVAIRKVLGASTIELVKMLNGSFLLMVFIANLVAWPLAYLFVSKWLSGFAYRIDLSIWPFILAFLISMLITLVTVSIRSYKAAVANTIDALKYE